MLKTDFTEGLSIDEAKSVACKVLQKTMDGVNLTSDKVEMFYLTRNKDTGEVFTQTLSL